jgi:hypothetical protein
MRNPPAGGQAERKKGLAAAFFFDGASGVCAKLMEISGHSPASPLVATLHPSRVTLFCPRFAVFCPRFAVFCPRVCFLLFCISNHLSLSLLPMKRERDRRVETEKTAIQELGKFGIPTSKRWLSKKGPTLGCRNRLLDVFGNYGTTNPYKSTTCRIQTAFTSIQEKKLYAPREPVLYYIGFSLISFAGSAAGLAHNLHVSSKKGLIGFGSLIHRCDASRSSFADSAASSFVPPFMVARWEARKGLPVRASGVRSTNPSSHRPHLVVGAVVFANYTAWRPHMARQSTSSFSPAREELLRDIHADAQTMSLALSALFDLLQGCDVDHQVSAGGLLGLLEPISGGMETLVGDMGTARNFGVHQ